MNLCQSAEVTQVPGVPAPSLLVLEDISGETRSLDEFLGSVVIVNFWATWCPPCLREFPSLERLKSAMKGRPLEILAVNSQEQKAKVRRFRRLPQNGIRVLLDNKGVETKRWGIGIYPTSFVLDRDGRVVLRILGDIEWDGEEAMGWIKELLGENPSE